jgi:hypothetical protein
MHGDHEYRTPVGGWMSAERLVHAHRLIGLRKRGRAAFRPSRAIDIRHNLEERKRVHRLPGEQAFWELMRIALDERPASFYDDLRLRACLIQILMGLHVGEIATPWARHPDRRAGEARQVLLPQRHDGARCRPVSLPQNKEIHQAQRPDALSIVRWAHARHP